MYGLVRPVCVKMNFVGGAVRVRVGGGTLELAGELCTAV